MADRADSSRVPAAFRAALPSFFAGPDVLVLYVVLLATVTVAFLVRRPALQVPGYLLVAGFDFFRNPFLPTLSGLAFDVVFAGYLYALAVVAAGLVRLLTNAFVPRTDASVR